MEIPSDKAFGASPEGAVNVDFLILSFERLADTLCAIDSALSQTGIAGRVIVVEQGSSAETVEALRQRAAADERILLDLQDHNLGAPGGRRRGMELSNAEFVASLDNDATYQDNETVAEAVAILQSSPQLAAVGITVLLSSSKELDRLSWPHRLDWIDRATSTFEAVQFAEGAVVIRRAAYDTTPGWRARLFFYWEGLDLAYSLLAKGWSILHAGHLAILHNVSAERRVQWREGRFYYYARNRVAIEHDYFGITKAMRFALWYLCLGVTRRCLGQTVRGVRDARQMRDPAIPRRISPARRKAIEHLYPSPVESLRIAKTKLRRSHHGE
jgi:GT2 family glycosyltransferase